MTRFAQIILPLLVLCSSCVAPVNDKTIAWKKLVGEEISQALASRTLGCSGDTMQDFEPSGRTLYDAGQPSWGYWRVQGDQYCSQWPPQGMWSCYDLFVSKNGRELKFVGESGDVSVGKYIDLN